MRNSISVDIQDDVMSINYHGETVTVPTNDVTLALFRFIRDDDVCLFVDDHRQFYDDDGDDELSYAK